VGADSLFIDGDRKRRRIGLRCRIGETSQLRPNGQPTPPLERRRVVVRRQQLKRLENCVWPVSVWAVQAYEENNITTDTGIMLRHFWTCSNQEAANQATANGNQAVGETKANKESQTADVLESGKEAVGKTKAIDSQSTPATNKDATPATDKQSICGQETGPQFN